MKHWPTRQNITLFTLATAAFYIFLASNIFHIGQYFAPTDYVSMETSGETLPITTKSEQYINDAMQEIRMMPSHQAADMTSDKTKFWAICNSNPLLCNEVDFQ
ncbi:MAG: hypothetical protein WCG98_10570 [bacterium]